MDDLSKKITEILRLTNMINVESVFQQNHKYKKFKGIYMNILSSGQVPELMISGLYEIGFYNETIFWCKKIIENMRFCDKEKRSKAFHMITVSFCHLEDYENVLEYGKKYLENNLELDTPLKNWSRKKDVIVVMKYAASELNMKQDAMKYAKELLKIQVALYNAKEIEKYELLLGYYDLIDLQIQLGHSKSAKKIMDKHLKLFNLNSLDLNDVLLSMEEAGYYKILPFSTFTSNTSNNVKKEILFSEYMENWLNVEKYEHWATSVKLFYLISKICWQKHILDFGGPCHVTQGPHNPSTVILKNPCTTWGHLSWTIYVDIVKHTFVHLKFKEQNDLVGNDIVLRLEQISEIELPVDRILCDTISTALLLADHDYSNRAEIFETLFTTLFSSSQCGILLMNSVKNISYHIGQAQKANDKIDGRKVMPFIQFCLKSLNENVGDNGPGPSLDNLPGANSQENVGLKMQFLTLKNSLVIVNHFQTNGEKEEY